MVTTGRCAPEQTAAYTVMAGAALHEAGTLGPFLVVNHDEVHSETEILAHGASDLAKSLFRHRPVEGLS